MFVFLLHANLCIFFNVGFPAYIPSAYTRTLFLFVFSSHFHHCHSFYFISYKWVKLVPFKHSNTSAYCILTLIVLVN